MNRLLIWLLSALFTQMLAQQSNQHTINNPSSQIHSDHASYQQNLQPMSEQQKQKMLKQQSLLDELAHSSDRASIWKSANITQEQLEALQKKWREQVRLVYEKALLQSQQRQRLKRQQLQKILEQEKLTKTQEINHRETIQFGQRQMKFNPRIYSQGKHGYYRHHFNDYMFQLDNGESDDFQITLVAGQSIALHSSTYFNLDGVYSVTTDIEDEVPPFIEIHEQNRLIIANQSFYFKKFMVFEGKANTKYLIRINNPRKSRLFALSVVQIVDKKQVQHALTSDDLQIHGLRAQKLYQQLSQTFDSRQIKETIQMSNQNRLSKDLDNYYVFIIIQLVAVIGFCLVQIKLIDKLLSNALIV